MLANSSCHAGKKDVSVGPLVQACAGALAGCVARCIVAPLDVVKIRLQVCLPPMLSNVLVFPRCPHARLGPSAASGFTPPQSCARAVLNLSGPFRRHLSPLAAPLPAACAPYSAHMTSAAALLLGSSRPHS